MKSPAADALGQVLISLAGSDAYRLDLAVETFCRFGIGPALHPFAPDLQQMVIAAQRLWHHVRTTEALKMPSSVAWRLALTTIEEGLERYLEEMHQREDGQQAVRA
jgi:hypothetical protein